jgi:putative SOS response-associated peptidase YedK
MFNSRPTISVVVKHPEVEHKVRVLDFDRWAGIRRPKSSRDEPQRRVRELLKRNNRQMCGRFSLGWEEWQNVAGKLGLDAGAEIAANYKAHHNIAPTDTHFIVTTEYERRRAQVARWGLVNGWARDNRQASKCINARAETIEQRTSFREAFHQRRCVVPADGFYEWTGPKKDRRPLRIHPRDGELMLFAGLYFHF